MPLSCKEYDTWKESQNNSILTNYINDEPYFKERVKYFTVWTTRIRRFYDDRIRLKEGPDWEAAVGIELPPYSMEEMRMYEQANGIYLPIQLKFYLTYISRWIAKYHGAVFQIYDTVDSEDMKALFNVELAKQRLTKERSGELALLRLPFLSRQPDPIPSNTVHMDSCCEAFCDMCGKDITIQLTECDICQQELCEICAQTHSADHHVVTIARKPFWPTGRLCTRAICLQTVDRGRKKQNYIDQCEEYGYCWSCGNYCCGRCFDELGDTHDCEMRGDAAGKYMKYRSHHDTHDEVAPNGVPHDEVLPNAVLPNAVLPNAVQKRESQSQDEKTLMDKYDWRFGPGEITIGVYGCGEIDVMFINSNHKGEMYFLVYIGTHHYRMLGTFFNYLCYSRSMNF